jgi:hypothetical protein
MDQHASTDADEHPHLEGAAAPAPVEGPAGDPPARRSRALLAAVALAVVFAVAAAVLAVLVAQGSDDSELESVRETAGRFGAALVTYDYHHPKTHRDAVLAFATGSFREEYQDAFDQGLSQVITEVKAVSTGYVKDVYVSAVDEERAQAIVAVDIEHEGTSGRNTLYDVYFRLTMVRVHGAWKVDQVTDLNFDTGSGAGSTPAADAESTTTTTASAVTSIP